MSLCDGIPYVGHDRFCWIIQFFVKITMAITVSVIVQELGLSDRAIDEYIAILKNTGELHRKAWLNRKSFGALT